MNTKLGNDFEKMCGVRPVALNSTIMDKSQYAPTDRGSVISTMRPDNADKQEQKIRELQKRVSQASVYISMQDQAFEEQMAKLKADYVKELDKSAQMILDAEQEQIKQMDMAEQNRKVMQSEIDYLKNQVHDLEQ